MTAAKTIWVLQVGRGFAAVAVVAYHAAAYTATFSGGIPPELDFFTSRGFLGVDFFFVLSGFIIHYVNERTGSPWLFEYLRSRFLRVFVPYLPVGIGIALAYTMLPFLSAGDREWQWLPTLTLLPGSTALVVAWTLQYEVVFYAVYALSKSVGHPLLGVASWTGLALGYNALVGNPGVMSPFLGTLTIEFLFGMLAVEMVKARCRTVLGASVAFCGYIAFDQTRELFGLAMALALVAIVRQELEHAVKVPKSLTYLGGASYSIYLVHNPICALTVRIFYGWIPALIASFAFGLAAGIAYHLMVERPLLRQFRKLVAT